jgi:glucose-1-phosphate cytidylyltransferase
MMVVLLAGGLGTRLREETEFRPKPMVEIGGRPILWHIMKIYAAAGYNVYYAAAGYNVYYDRERYSGAFNFASNEEDAIPLAKLAENSY